MKESKKQIAISDIKGPFMEGIGVQRGVAGQAYKREKISTLEKGGK